MSNETTATTKRRRLQVPVSAKTTMQAPSMGFLLGGRYLLGAQLGRGGMGVVFSATDQELQVPVAIKILTPELACAARAVSDLKREAALAMGLHHPGIMGLFHFAAAEETKYLVMELLEGETLEARLQREQVLPLERVVALAREVAAALDYAHAEGVVHRDIKPDNLFLHRKGGREQVRLMDFGIARQMRDAFARVTQQFDASGTLLYVSPEQLQGKRVDGRADVYSLAATLYECLAGHPPFYQGSISYQVVNNAPEPLAELSPGVNAALLAGLAKDPAARPATAGDFAAALAAAAAAVTSPERVAGVAKPPVRSVGTSADGEMDEEAEEGDDADLDDLDEIDDDDEDGEAPGDGVASADAEPPSFLVEGDEVAVDDEEARNIRRFLKTFGDSRAAICVVCLAEYRADVRQCPTCRADLEPGPKATERLRAMLEEAPPSASVLDEPGDVAERFDCGSAGNVVADAVPELDHEQRRAIAQFLATYGDSREAICVACLDEYRASITTCPVCSGELVPASEALVTLRSWIAKSED